MTLPGDGNKEVPPLTGRNPTDPPPLQMQASLKLSWAFSLLVLCLSCMTGVGWLFHLPLLTSVLSNYATMKPNTALCLGLLGLSSLLVPTSRHPVTRYLAMPWRYGLVRALQGTAFAISGLTLCEYVFHSSFGFDQWLLFVPADGLLGPTGRMSAGSAILLTSTAAAYLLRDSFPRVSVWLCMGGILASVSSLVGFVFSAAPLLAVPWFKSLAVHTATALLLLQVAGLASRPAREPWHSLVLSRREGRRRYLLFAVMFGPFLSALPVVWGLHRGFYDAFFALALLLVLLLCVQTWILWAENRTVERAQLNLRVSEHRASRVLDSIGDAVIVTDAADRIDRMNPVAEQLTGWKGEEAKGRALTEVFQIVHEETRQVVENPADKVRRLGAVVGMANHTVLLSRSGTQTHIDDSSAPIWGDSAELAGVVLVFRNVDERRQSERLLQASYEKLKIALETVALGSFESNLITNLFRCSTQCRANFGRFSQAPFSYSDLVHSIHPEDRILMQEAVQKAIQTQAVYRAEYRITWPDGTPHWILACGRVLFDEDRTPHTMVGVTLDVTERHQAAAALIQSEKLAAVGRLASSIAHEINNPLESVTNLLFLMREGNDLAEIKGYIQIAERELRRASGITSQTLRFHKQSSHPTPNTFADLLDVVVSIYQGKLWNSLSLYRYETGLLSPYAVSRARSGRS